MGLALLVIMHMSYHADKFFNNFFYVDKMRNKKTEVWRVKKIVFYFGIFNIKRFEVKKIKIIYLYILKGIDTVP